MSQEEKEAWERVGKAIGELAEAAVRAIKTVIDAIAKAIKPYVDSIVELYLRSLKNAPPRIKYLAFHSKKARIRKKNLKRLWAYG